MRLYIRGMKDLKGKTVVDIPCGDGRASYEFLLQGAKVLAFDLFPEFMTIEGFEASHGDLTGSLPLADESVDYIVCQEGIEHVSNHVGVLREFNRVLRPGGRVLLTTPNISQARTRVSALLFETDFWQRMPPTAIDSVWFATKDREEMYFGHLFQVGVQHLMTLADITGFEVEQRIRTDLSTGGVILGIVLYPFLCMGSILTWLSYRRKNTHVPRAFRDRIFRQRVLLNLSPTTLFCKHTFWILKKHSSLEEVIDALKKQMRKPLGPEE